MFDLKLVVLVAMFTAGVLAADDHPYYCTTDSYCKKHYPGTVCIPVHNYGVSKCTPETSERPACRGVQAGLCPSYQSPDRGYLNAHCVFVPEDYLPTSSNVTSGSGSSRRLLTSAGSDNGSVTITTSTEADSTLTVKLNKEKVTGQFVCLQISECQNLAADTNTCYPSACGSPESQEQCNNQGTCTYKNKTKITKRSCKCYAGFEGDKCENEVSNACDVDCGTGGDCVDNECVCKEGFDGKAYNGKKGNATERCTHCTNDLACEYNNTCNLGTGKCNCAAGYTGDWCGAVEDSCTTRTDCGIGACQVLSNGSSACYCPQCSPTCSLCEMAGASSFDCSSCPTDGAQSLLPSEVVILVFVATLLANLTL
ncbi:GPI-anchored serine rich tenascin-like glycoprotein [Phytophthora megakarya]|uniref:GPI-anchored serine rich tenascin-like glycoprotein n=1 Tax=Phytophthora megakarya TaxID=4795 RepID=A0A225UNE2_9STRA|nr:GPI-anchored serine rich tenascin-like glycoprotein [Phytophthora megakarya]